MKNMCIMLISGMVGALGFAILFHVRPKRLAVTVLGAGLSLLIYLLFDFLGIFAANLLAAFCMTLYCEGVARRIKTPAITLLTPAIVVLVPGGMLYDTFSHVLSEEYALAGQYAVKTGTCCLGITAGIRLAAVVVRFAVALAEKSFRKNRVKR